MNKMHSGQLFSVLLLSGAWTVLCTPAISSGGQCIGVLLAAALQLPLAFLLPALQHRGFSLNRTISRRKWLGLLYVLCLLLCGAQSFAQFWTAAPRMALPVSGRLTAAVLITTVCLYTCSLTLRALSRGAPFVLGFLLLMLLVLVIGALPRLDVIRFTPAAEGLVQGGLSYFCTSGELIAALVLLDRMEQRSGRRAMLCYLAAKAALAWLLIFLCVCVCGRLLQLEDFPFFTLTALSQPLREQRADALYLIVFQVLFIVHITLLAGTAAHLLRTMFPRFRIAAPAALAGMLLLALLPAVPGTLTGGLCILTAAFVLPLLFYLLRRCSHEKKTAPAASPAASDGMQQNQHR